MPSVKAYEYWRSRYFGLLAVINIRQMTVPLDAGHLLLCMRAGGAVISDRADGVGLGRFSTGGHRHLLVVPMQCGTQFVTNGVAAVCAGGISTITFCQVVPVMAAGLAISWCLQAVS